MQTDQLKENFKEQFREEIAKQGSEAEKVAFSSGALIVLSALIAKDGPSIPMQIRIMHAALRDVGDEMGWGVAKASD